MDSTMTTTYPAFQPDGNGTLARIGLIYIASSIVMDAEMGAMSAPGVAVHTTRLKLPKVTVEGIEEMMQSPQLEEAAPARRSCTARPTTKP
jgi:maleate isomerase